MTAIYVYIYIYIYIYIYERRSLSKTVARLSTILITRDSRYEAFRDMYFEHFNVKDHDSIMHFIACIVLVSANEEDPVEKVKVTEDRERESELEKERERERERES